jgi:RNA polymerase sigma factor (sigma-70 family)
MEPAMKRTLSVVSAVSEATAPFTGPSRSHAPPPTKTMDVIQLVARARRGERTAWSTLLERYLPLIRAVARGYRLNDADVEDVGQTVCLRLIENLDRIREPAALPAWITTTARRESLRLTRNNRRTIPVDPLIEAKHNNIADDHSDPDANLLRAEQAQVLGEGLAYLPRTQRNLLLLLADDQPRSYREIGQLLAMPVGSIGPTRARGVTRLRATPAIHDYFAASTGSPHQRSA